MNKPTERSGKKTTDIKGPKTTERDGKHDDRKATECKQ